ncbi:hypothetical protein [Deinococcus frigens]|uniref:hypothetical protein n=1 Tax=Deinococcus frigens TaxID=249403 RepID=UPI000ADAE3ED|nr:hypothetical protein [Deinococcus frigens]
MNRGGGPLWIHAAMLLLVALLLGWVPVLGPLLLGVLAGRAAPGGRGAAALLPALALQTALLLGARWAARTVQDFGLDGGLWTAVAWLGSPLSAALGRPLGHVLGSATLAGFLLLYILPALPGLLIGAQMARRSTRW